MLYNDKIYGPVEIGEPLLLELMQTAAMQRLKGVLQHGISALIGLTSPITRFDHSVGTMLLVRRLGATVEEQAAALLHDVSHTAFSHVIDYVFDNRDNQNYHDEVKESYAAGTDLPAVLAQHGYADWRRLLREEEYSLLEQPSPALCADRLDYFLRDSLDMGLLTPAGVKRILDHLTTAEGRIIFTDREVAGRAARAYIAADQQSWANFREVGLYEVTALAIRRGLDIGAISQEDLWAEDRAVWQKLQERPDPELQTRLRLVSLDTRFEWDEEAPTFWVSAKLRTIDPHVATNGGAQPLSVLDPDFARFRESYLADRQGKWPMRVIPPAGNEGRQNH